MLHTTIICNIKQLDQQNKIKSDLQNIKNIQHDRKYYTDQKNTHNHH